ncbi:hypothetical protein BVC80_1719g93 [Macleaya cordata]|uniref:Ubiquitin-specific protease family C19-related protein n=1 Tax=Macleaya cordata TaxID=56857 RepID=A0A200Q2Q6_MACCD|nr:hypothetical protein BVC80_1719g93 [Macleaya cordata]
MNDLSNALTETHQNHRHCCNFEPIPTVALYILVFLFFVAFGFSIFILIVVHNAIFFISSLFLLALVLACLIWNVLNWSKNRAILIFLNSFPESDLSSAKDGQLVKITGSASCGDVSLESSFEKVPRCIYSSTCLYERRIFQSKAAFVNSRCYQWSLAYSERFSTDFYITDNKSGTRATVKAGSGAKVTPLIAESTIINTTSEHRVLSTYLRKWLGDRNLSTEARLLRLNEGYVKEGSLVTVIGLLHRNNDVVMIVQPPELISTGCLWKKLLFPVDIEGLILRVPESASIVGLTSISKRPSNE